MHLSKDQFGSIRHVLEDRFGDSLQTETTPHYRYNDKTGESMENGIIHTYTFSHSGQEFRLEIVEKEKVQEHEKMKDGRVVGRTFETVPNEFTYAMQLFRKNDADWTKVDLDLGELLGT